MKTISVDELLNQLPPYEDYWILLKKNQDVPDIIKEVLAAHQRYASYYDKIALYFDDDDVTTICKTLFKFCKDNIQYFEEPKKRQTTALPTGILVRETGDCKHFSSFCGGILDGINRLTGKKIEWWYRFASYNLKSSTPHHVFVVVLDEDGKELWIDATPFADNKEPIWQLDKQISSMALYTNIAGVEQEPTMAIGISSLTVSPFKGNNINFDGSNKYVGVFDPFLGLDWYRDLGGDRNISETTLADAINREIANGPHPGHTVAPDFVKWIYDESIRSWNFYFPNGVRPGFTADSLLPVSWPRPVITPDGRLTFDRDVKVDDYRNAEIHLLTAWLQSLINLYDTNPYPLKPRAVKEFSQNYTGNPGNLNANLFTEARGTGFFKEVGKSLEDTINFVKENVLKIVESIPRNAFLALIGVNVFNLAGNLWNEIQKGGWDHLRNLWEAVGGSPDRLYNTIETGKDKNAILGVIGCGCSDENAIGCADPVSSTACFIAAAAPLIVIFLQFINKDGKFNDVVAATEAGLNVAFPDEDFTFLNGILVNKKTNQPVQWIVDPKDNENLGGGNSLMPGSFMLFVKKNPILFAAGGTVGSYLLINKKGKKKNFLVPIAIGGGIYLVISQFLSSTTISSTTKRQQLISWISSLEEFTGTSATTESLAVRDHYINSFKAMTDGEINIVYDWIFNYVAKKIPLPTEGVLYNEMIALDQKYNLFGT